MAIVSATRPNTPMGAKAITRLVMRIMTSYTPSQKDLSVPPGPASMRVMKNPNRIEKKIRPSICPAAAAATMLVGTMRRKMPMMSPVPLPSMRSSTASVPASRPSWSPAGWPPIRPGETRFTMTRPIMMARKLVIR